MNILLILLRSREIWLAGIILVAISIMPASADPDYIVEVSGEDAHARDMAFDARRNRIYVTSTAGKIERYDFGSSTSLPPIELGGTIHGIDIDPAHRFIIAAQGEVGETTGVFHRIDLESGIVTDITYTLADREYGSHDVKIFGNGKALATTRFLGSGWVPFREIDINTNTATIRTDFPYSGIDPEVRQNTQINRSGDRLIGYVQEGNSGDGPRFFYDASTDSFSNFPNLGSSNRRGAVNHDGSLIGSHKFPNAMIETRGGATVRTFPGYNSGFTFDPCGRRLFLVDVNNDEIKVYSTISWELEFSISIGQNIHYTDHQFGEGHIRVSPDGSKVALLVDPNQFDTVSPRGVVVFDVAPAARVHKGNPSLSLRREITGDWILAISGGGERFYQIFESSDLVNWSLFGTGFGNSELKFGPITEESKLYWRILD